MLDMEDYRQIAKSNKDFRNSLNIKQTEIERQELERRGIITDSNDNENFHGDCDNPGSLENGTATILYILVMIGGAIFKDAWMIWIMATIVWFKFITRHMDKK